MLVALSEDHAYFSLTENIPKPVLQQLRKAQTFFCPQCKEPLILKLGHIKIPHFAHQKSSRCDTLFTEGESAAHLLGKQQLFSLFQRLQLKVELEPFLREIQQRPDLLVLKNNQGYAIEFQCSRISADLYRERTKGYLNQSITPIWILKTPSEKFKKQGLVKISLNHFHQLFLRKQKQSFLMTYDVDSQKFYYVTNLMFFQGQQYYGFVRSLPIMQQAFPFYEPKAMDFESFQLMVKQLKQDHAKYLETHLLVSRKGVNEPLLRGMYEMRVSRNQLPIFIGVPVKGSERFNSPTVEWQILFFYFLHCQQLTCSKLTEGVECLFLEWLGMPVDEDVKQVVNRYIQLLHRFAIDTISSKVHAKSFIRYVYDEFVAIE